MGADVTVYERDAALDSRPQGCRLHVDARAGMALQRCLPPELFDAFLATCGQPGRSFTVLSERLRILHRVVGPAAGSRNAREPAPDPLAPDTLSTSVHRQTLREILAAGVDIRFGQPVAGFSTDQDAVTVHLADGTRSGRTCSWARTGSVRRFASGTCRMRPPWTPDPRASTGAPR
jgi:hypothetical protein